MEFKFINAECEIVGIHTVNTLIELQELIGVEYSTKSCVVFFEKKEVLLEWSYID